MTASPNAFPAYLLGLGTWFVPLGIQMVLFPWLVAVVLHMDAFAVGVAQAALMAPGILFLPLGGLVADRGNPRRLLLRYHLLYAVPPLALAAVLMTGALSYPLLIAYGIAAGSDRRLRHSDPRCPVAGGLQGRRAAARGGARHRACSSSGSSWASPAPRPPTASAPCRCCSCMPA